MKGSRHIHLEIDCPLLNDPLGSDCNGLSTYSVTGGNLRLRQTTPPRIPRSIPWSIVRKQTQYCNLEIRAEQVRCENWPAEPQHVGVKVCQMESFNILIKMIRTTEGMLCSNLGTRQFGSIFSLTLVFTIKV